MAKEHNFSLTEINDMYPFERDIYFILIENYIKEQQKLQNST